MDIKIGQKLTIITSGAFLGNTVRAELQITREVKGEFAYKNKGKRNEYYFRPNKETLVFEGWDLPIDSNTNEGGSSFVLSSGGINIIYRPAPQDVAAAREYIEKNNLNDGFADQKYLELHYHGNTLARLYPELQ